MPGNCCGGDDHEPSCNLNPAKDRSADFSLHKDIKWPELEVLNESRSGDGKKVFKDWDDRLSEGHVETDIDGDMIFNIPFNGEVKLRGIIIVAEAGETHPKSVKIFRNLPRTFDDVQGKPEQEIQLHPDLGGVMEYPVRTVKFGNMTHMTLYFPGNYGGGEVTKISYIGLHGEVTNARREAITITNYEARPNIADHKNAIEDAVRHVF